MSTMGDFVTLLDTPQASYATYEGGTVNLPKTYMWEPELTTQTENITLPLGARLLMPLGILCVFSFILLVMTLFSPIPFISAKFALFLVLLFGGFIGELLYAKKIKNG